jgi:hypothetical protein
MVQQYSRAAHHHHTISPYTMLYIYAPPPAYSNKKQKEKTLSSQRLASRWLAQAQATSTSRARTALASTRRHDTRRDDPTHFFYLTLCCYICELLSTHNTQRYHAMMPPGARSAASLGGTAAHRSNTTLSFSLCQKSRQHTARRPPSPPGPDPARATGQQRGPHSLGPLPAARSTTHRTFRPTEAQASGIQIISAHGIVQLRSYGHATLM